ncbi:MAG: MBOAT family protein [bacterium]|nr:MBOAT family protein [bacterium]
MVFSSAIFIFCFLPILFFFYFCLPKKCKNIVLLIFSLIFYAFGGANYLFTLLLTVFISYLGGILIKKCSKKKLILFLTIALNLSFLIYFKYTGFILSNINNLFNLNISIPSIIMPIGISFYTFQSISYVIDVYRNEVEVQKNYFLLLLYVSLFPQLVAGPIVRYKTVESEIKTRKTTLYDFCYGIERFILGLAKKVIIANQMGKLADIVFNTDSFTTPVVWLGAIAYMMQIYFDFSAYSDMAIGLGRILGFKFLENFNFPYIAKSITEFWRRWHISLSTFFRDYIYIPLGGNRCSKKRQIFNMSVVWILTGLWHGASWNFVLWGLYYLFFLILEKYVFKNVLDKIPNVLRHALTLLIVLIGWMLFRLEDLSVFKDVIISMFNFNFTTLALSEARIYLETYYIYFILAIIFSTPIYYIVCEKFKKYKLFEILKYLGLLVLFIITIMFLAQSSYNPFIYFRF